MNHPMPFASGTAQLGAAQRNRVLRNTYSLLAVSLLPTVAGAWLGVSTGLGALFTGGFGLIAFLVGAFGFMWAIEKNKDRAAGVYLLLGFTFFMGVMLSRLIGAVLGLSNGANLIMLAFGGTAAVFATMAMLANVIKRDLSGMGKFLIVGAVIMMVAGIANFFFQSSALMLALLVACLALFSAFLLYDLKRVVDGGETNYVSATLAIYLDLYNIFQSLLSLLGIFGGERD
ncbi:Bax inhibitor-1 family protein [Inhella gelatinilytica]|uniref:Bax inhibitor-1 family protein n=1 Tax=Inhella gelatinilytica TaxID=2795030 RepID=A0A931IYJ1_9BURK|nr:Bax inhibitor-1 family protein [Inhella gelatinilytica]MBH9553350.1 Bax inhibitor-1 family protein [Inhella gelatinilytica]